MWDTPTRLFHWALVLLFATSWWTAENLHMEWHRWSGYSIIGLLAFRIYWGFAGASTARFADFIKGPGEVIAYATGKRGPVLGHNPMGALSIVAMLALLITQVSLGLFAVDIDGLESGPLAVYVDFDTGRLASKWHHIVFTAMLVLIALHLLAIAFYALVKKDNLIGPMLSGRKRLEPGVDLMARFAPAWRILPGVAIAGALVFAVIKAFKF